MYRTPPTERLVMPPIGADVGFKKQSKTDLESWSETGSSVTEWSKASSYEGIRSSAATALEKVQQDKTNDGLRP